MISIERIVFLSILGLRCYKCAESIGCYRNPVKVVEECEGRSGTGPWVCLTATTFYYVPFARRGCATEDEINCYLEQLQLLPEGLNAISTLTNLDYSKLFVNTWGNAVNRGDGIW